MERPCAVPNPWITCPRPDPAARVRLFCFPYAGGGAGAFRAWVGELPGVEVCPLQPPGRETRFGESPLQRMADLVAGVLGALPLDRPFAFFGHSLGAALAYETAWSLGERGLPLPVLLAVSGRPAPHCPRRTPVLHTLGDEAFVEQLRRFGGTPEAVLANRELMALLLPILRGDFAASETYAPPRRPPLACPIAAFTGDADTGAPVEDVAAWQAYTAVDFRLQVFAGGHFYLHPQRQALLAALRAALADVGG